MALSPVAAADRSVTETLRLVERVVWSLLFVASAALVGAALAGAFVVSARPVDAPVVAFLAAAVGGTLVFVASEFAFE
jgi:anti-sigma-K factor RskA